MNLFKSEGRQSINRRYLIYNVNHTWWSRVLLEFGDGLRRGCTNGKHIIDDESSSAQSKSNVNNYHPAITTKSVGTLELKYKSVELNTINKIKENPHCR